MSLADEFERLAALHGSGALTDAEYARAKERLLETGRAPTTTGGALRIDKLRRSIDDRWIGGVCGGIAAVTGTETWIWRLLFAVGLLFGGVTGVLYLLMWLLVPSENDAGR